MAGETTCSPAPSSHQQVPGRDLTSGSIHRAIWFLAPAMALEMGILNVSDLLDAYWVSRLGSAALAAAAFSLTVRWLVNSISLGLGTGALAVVARRVGAGDQEAADHATGQVILLGTIVSALLAALGLAVSRPLLQLMGADAEVLPLGLAYLHTLFLGSFAWVLVQVINPMIRGAGDAWLAMRVLFLTTAVIVVSEPILVLGLGPIPKLGIAGSAGAYVLGFACGLIMQAVILLRGRACIRLRWRHLRPDLPLMARIVRIALPSALQLAFRAAATMVILVMVGSYGTFATAGYGLADRFQLIILVPCFGLGNTAGTLVGQNLGADKPNRAERCAWWVSAYAVGYLVTLATLLFVFARPAIAIFDSTPEVVEIGAECIRIIIFAIVFDGIGFVMGRSLDGAGDTVPAASTNLLTLWGLQLPAAFVLSRWLDLGLRGIWWGRALSYVANGLFLVTWFWRGKWKERKV
jgi:putative MATE family efflux protein